MPSLILQTTPASPDNELLPLRNQVIVSRLPHAAETAESATHLYRVEAAEHETESCGWPLWFHRLGGYVFERSFD